jgi:DnaJ-class molecular chaperone
MTFAERKAERTKEYMRWSGAKKQFCYACNGTGYYDNTGSPKCGCCGGKGWYREPNTDFNLTQPAASQVKS